MARDIEGTPTYQQAVISAQIGACEDLFTWSDKWDVLTAAVEQAQTQLKEVEDRIRDDANRKLEAARQRHRDAQRAFAKANTELDKDQANIEQAKSRVHFLTIDGLSEPDKKQITAAQGVAKRPFDEVLQRLIGEREAASDKSGLILRQLRESQQELSSLSSALSQMNEGTTPGMLAHTLEEVSSKIATDHDSKTAGAEARLRDALAAQELVQRELRDTEGRLKTVQPLADEWLRTHSRGLLSRMASSTWWLGVLNNPVKEAQDIIARKTVLAKRLKDLSEACSKHAGEYQELVSSKETSILAAVEAARTQLEEEWRQRREILTSDVVRLKEHFDNERVKVNETEQQIGEVTVARQEAMEVVASKTRDFIVARANDDLCRFQSAVDSAIARVSACGEVMTVTERELEDMPADDVSRTEAPLVECRRRLSVAEEELHRHRASIDRVVSSNGLAISPPYSRVAVERYRDQLAVKLRSHTAANQVENSVGGVSSGGTSNVSAARRQAEPISSTVSVELGALSGNLYIDLDRNAEDSTDSRGRNWPGLRRQLGALRRRYSGGLFKDLPQDGDFLVAFRDAFFPQGMRQSYAISNLSLQDNQAVLALRPIIIGPRLERFLPAGVTLSVTGRLWDHQRDADNPILLVQRIVDLSNSRTRSFERELSVVVHCMPSANYPITKRQKNAITSEFVSSLPPISAVTRDRLNDWRAYLDWKERLVRVNLGGLRYVRVEMEADGTYRFSVVTESKEELEKSRRTLRNGSLRAFGLGYSTNEWAFQYNDNHRGRDKELGDFLGIEHPCPLPSSGMDGIPWRGPYAGFVRFRMSEDDQIEFDSMIDSGRIQSEVHSHFLGQLSPAGFLALSVVGDMSLIDRQRRELEELQRQSGYAPFLSSYLFDINQANAPTVLVDIQESDWFRSDLNDDQKQAVRMMVSAPDLALVQGPPGTGKTTMIAEAIWQLVRQGKKVLVVSQANLAVDNALERLPQVPNIRAIRLGRRGEGDQPYSQTRAIETYYQGIADSCRNRTLNPWREGERRRTELNRWLTDSSLLFEDISVQGDLEVELSSEISAISSECITLSANSQRVEELERLRRSALEFLQFLSHDAEWSGSLPESVLRVLWVSVVSPLDKLCSVGIRLNQVWPAYEYGHEAERSRYAVAIVRQWRELLMALPQLRGDLIRLKGTEGDSVIGSEDALRLSELNRRLAEVAQAMIEDDSRLPEWKAIQRDIQSLRREGSGLTRGVYERVFNLRVDGVAAHLKYTNPRASRTEVVSKLAQSIALIEAVHSEVNAGLLLCEEAMRGYLESLVAPTLDPVRVHQLEGQLQELRQRLNEVQQQRSGRADRLLRLMREEYRSDAENIAVSVSEYPALRKAVEERLSSVEAQLSANQRFRDDWEPILESWIESLSNPEVVARDQATILGRYIASCNVVGVTCTENRRTLEDAGHMRFDVVIVDEVSKATPPEIIMPLLMARTAILVGDHRQLPPLFKEHEGSFEEVVAEREEGALANEPVDPASELTEENFERFRKMVTSSLFKEHFEAAPQSLRAFLFTQYRMHPQIMRAVNQFYENRLVCGLSDPDAKEAGSDPRGHRTHGMKLVGYRSQTYLTPEQHVLWLDSTKDPLQQMHHERIEGAGGKVNYLEAAIVAKCLIDIEMACRMQGYGSGKRDRKRVGVVTFYARQVRAIREAVRRFQKLRGIEFSAIREDVNTVDRYQGQERPIIIVSMVRNPPWKLSPRAITAQFERINVAFSRAQELLIVTGAKDVFCSYPVNLPFLDRPGHRLVDVYRYIIDEIQRSGGFWSSDAIIDAQDFSQLLPKGVGVAVRPSKPRKRK